MKKGIFIILGIISLILGIIGIFIPGLPTTPFLLLSASLFIKSSAKLYNWLIKNKFLGTYISDYYNNKGLSKLTKIFSVSLMWIMIAVSVFLIFNTLIPKILVIVLALIGTIVMGFLIPTVKK